MTKKDIHAILGPNFEYVSLIHVIMGDQGINWDAGQYDFYFDDDKEILNIFKTDLDTGKILDPLTSIHEAARIPNPAYDHKKPPNSVSNPTYFLCPIVTLIPYEFIQIIYLRLDKSKFRELTRKSQSNSKGFAKYINLIKGFWDGTDGYISLDPDFKNDLEGYLSLYNTENVDKEDDLILTFTPENLFTYMLLNFINSQEDSVVPFTANPAEYTIEESAAYKTFIESYILDPDSPIHNITNAIAAGILPSFTLSDANTDFSSPMTTEELIRTNVFAAIWDGKLGDGLNPLYKSDMNELFAEFRKAEETISVAPEARSAKEVFTTVLSSLIDEDIIETSELMNSTARDILDVITTDYTTYSSVLTALATFGAVPASVTERISEFNFEKSYRNFIKTPLKSEYSTFISLSNFQTTGFPINEDYFSAANIYITNADANFKTENSISEAKDLVKFLHDKLFEELTKPVPLNATRESIEFYSIDSPVRSIYAAIENGYLPELTNPISAGDHAILGSLLCGINSDYLKAESTVDYSKLMRLFADRIYPNTLYKGIKVTDTFKNALNNYKNIVNRYPTYTGSLLSEADIFYLFLLFNSKKAVTPNGFVFGCEHPRVSDYVCPSIEAFDNLDYTIDRETITGVALPTINTISHNSSSHVFNFSNSELLSDLLNPATDIEGTSNTYSSSVTIQDKFIQAMTLYNNPDAVMVAMNSYLTANKIQLYREYGGRNLINWLSGLPIGSLQQMINSDLLLPVTGGEPEDYPERILDFRLNNTHPSVVIDIETTLASAEFTLPILNSKEYFSTRESVVVDWGDGTLPVTLNDTSNIADFSHTYLEIGQYQVFISGSLSKIGGENIDWLASELVKNINSLGELGITDISYLFSGGSSFSLPYNIPNTITNASYLFKDVVSILNPEALLTWDTKNITNMTGMFEDNIFGESSRYIWAWDTGNVTNMTNMFKGCISDTFNPVLSFFNMKSIVDCSGMFSLCNNSAFTKAGAGDEEIHPLQLGILNWEFTRSVNLENFLNGAAVQDHRYLDSIINKWYSAYKMNNATASNIILGLPVSQIAPVDSEFFEDSLAISVLIYKMKEMEENLNWTFNENVFINIKSLFATLSTEFKNDLDLYSVRYSEKYKLKTKLEKDSFVIFLKMLYNFAAVTDEIDLSTLKITDLPMTSLHEIIAGGYLPVVQYDSEEEFLNTI